MIRILERLCRFEAPSGKEDSLRDFLQKQIGGAAETRVDAAGNLIVFKKGKKRPQVRLMLDAHMDEIGLIVTYITDGGLLKFSTVGGIDASVLLGRRVVFDGAVVGVIGAKPVHLMQPEEQKKLPSIDAMHIDIGAKSREEAEALLSVGDMAVFDSDFLRLGEHRIKARAIDDRAGCAILLSLLLSELEYDMTFVFSVQEEVGLRGAQTAAYAVEPQAAIVVEATTAADFAGTPADRQVCRLGAGAALSFMDGATLYDKGYYDAAMETAARLGIPCQPKAAVAGGNNAGSIHKSRAGVRTLAVSVPCRYIHSASCLADLRDIEASAALVRAMAEEIASGNLE